MSTVAMLLDKAAEVMMEQDKEHIVSTEEVVKDGKREALLLHYDDGETVTIDYRS